MTERLRCNAPKSAAGADAREDGLRATRSPRLGHASPCPPKVVLPPQRQAKRRATGVAPQFFDRSYTVPASPSLPPPVLHLPAALTSPTPCAEKLAAFGGFVLKAPHPAPEGRASTGRMGIPKGSPPHFPFVTPAPPALLASRHFFLRKNVIFTSPFSLVAQLAPAFCRGCRLRGVPPGWRVDVAGAPPRWAVGWRVGRRG